MKKILLFILACTLGANSFAQTGFPSSATNWSIPIGGLINGSNNWGYYMTGFTQAHTYGSSCQNWNVMDINGDGRPDLVVTSEYVSPNYSPVFSPTSNPFWKVYLNTGSGYSSSVTNWSLPIGGFINGSNNWGFYMTSFTQAHTYGSSCQNWSLMDMNGDNRPDLVVTSEYASSNYSPVYSPTSNPYWKVYLNTGTGFSTTATNWSLPVGGFISGSNNWGYYMTAFTQAHSYGSSCQNWSLMDIDGDNKPDLVVTSEYASSNYSPVYSPTSNPYWKVYLNTGTGFSTTATNWSLPVGGLISGSNNWGYYMTAFTQAHTYGSSCQNWTVRDMNGDNKPDLVVTSEYASANYSPVYSPTSNPFWKVYLNTGTGFSTTATNWSLPIGGLVSGSTLWGYYMTDFTQAFNYSSSCQNWSVMDIDGDNKPDLVVTSEWNSANFSPVFSPTSNPFWKIYLNTGTGFSTTATNWSLPIGGLVNGSTLWGYYMTGFSQAFNYSSSCQNWSVMDMNGDSKLDLVVTSEYASTNYSPVYSPTSNPFWKVYYNNSTVGFAEAKTDMEDLDVFPNPGSGVFTISGRTEGKINVYNSLGKLVFTVENRSFKPSIEIDLSSLEAGVYNVVMGHSTKKLIKQ